MKADKETKKAVKEAIKAIKAALKDDDDDDDDDDDHSGPGGGDDDDGPGDDDHGGPGDDDEPDDGVNVPGDEDDPGDDEEPVDDGGPGAPAPGGTGGGPGDGQSAGVGGSGGQDPARSAPSTDAYANEGQSSSVGDQACTEECGSPEDVAAQDQGDSILAAESGGQFQAASRALSYSQAPDTGPRSHCAVRPDGARAARRRLRRRESTARTAQSLGR